MEAKADPVMHKRLANRLHNWESLSIPAQKQLRMDLMHWSGDAAIDIHRREFGLVGAGDIAPRTAAEQAWATYPPVDWVCQECGVKNYSPNGPCGGCYMTRKPDIPTPPQADAAQGDAGELVIPEQRGWYWVDFDLASILYNAGNTGIVCVEPFKRTSEWGVFLQRFPTRDLAKRHAEQQVGAVQKSVPKAQPRKCWGATLDTACAPGLILPYEVHTDIDAPRRYLCQAHLQELQGDGCMCIPLERNVPAPPACSCCASKTPCGNPDCKCCSC